MTDSNEISRRYDVSKFTLERRVDDENKSVEGYAKNLNVSQIFLEIEKER